MSKFILLYISFKSNMLFRDLSTGNFLVTAVVLVAPVDTFLFVLLRILLSCSPQVFTNSEFSQTFKPITRQPKSVLFVHLLLFFDKKKLIKFRISFLVKTCGVEFLFSEEFTNLGAFQCKFDEQFELFEHHDAYAETSESISVSFQGSWHSP
jgi:hypothetical protein